MRCCDTFIDTENRNGFREHEPCGSFYFRNPFVFIKFFKKKNTNTKPASPQSNSTKANLFKIQTFAMLSNLDSQNSDDNNDSFCSTSLNTNSSLN